MSVSERSHLLFLVTCTELIIKHIPEHIFAHKSVGDNPFACNYCEYSTDCKCHLRLHLHINEGLRDGQFFCNYCDSWTDQNGMFNQFIFCWHDSNWVKPIACSFCKYKMVWKDLLRLFICTHKSVRVESFVCNHCKYQGDRKGINQHLERMDVNPMNLEMWLQKIIPISF